MNKSDGNFGEEQAMYAAAVDVVIFLAFLHPMVSYRESKTLLFYLWFSLLVTSNSYIHYILLSLLRLSVAVPCYCPSGFMMYWLLWGQ
jgi:hypothetical protein